jgi:hypothetical protein
VKASTLPSMVTRRAYATAAVEAVRQRRQLDALAVKTSDEQRALGQARAQFFAAMEKLALPGAPDAGDAREKGKPAGGGINDL